MNTLTTNLMQHDRYNTCQIHVHALGRGRFF